ncbi:alpha/beta-hydrolase, partial [Linderina pennispora]
TWTCHINCQADDTKGTVVDYHWDTSTTLNPSYGFVAHKDDTKEIIVSWRGSTILMDWIKDFTFLPVSWPSSVSGSKVHQGFLQTYSSASSGIEAAVSKLVAKHPDYSIVLTGHSLGGGEAAIAAADYAARHPEWLSKLKLFTFGEPRVGNPAFAGWLSQQPFPIYRTVYKGDLVPRAPFQFMGFKHHSQEVWYDENGALKFQGSNGESPYGENSLTPLQWSVLDHLRYPGLS